MRGKSWAALALAFCASAAWGAVPAPQEDGSAKRGQEVWSSGKGGCRELPQADSARLGMIRQMLDAGKPHAAIAYLDAAHIVAPQASLLRADGLRETGREEEAVRLYRQLLGSCVAGYAYQGLGLTAGKAGNFKEAVMQLRAASNALPIDPAIRNDYGYALMSTGDDQAALHEFLTSIELAPGNLRAAHNLILLLTRRGENDKARAVAEQFGIAAGELSRLQQLAQQPQTAPAASPAAKTVAVVALPDPDDETPAEALPLAQAKEATP